MAQRTATFLRGRTTIADMIEREERLRTHWRRAGSLLVVKLAAAGLPVSERGWLVTPGLDGVDIAKLQSRLFEHKLCL